jgi:hypothetical protein
VGNVRRRLVEHLHHDASSGEPRENPGSIFESLFQGNYLTDLVQGEMGGGKTVPEVTANFERLEDGVDSHQAHPAKDKRENSGGEV